MDNLHSPFSTDEKKVSYTKFVEGKVIDDIYVRNGII